MNPDAHLHLLSLDAYARHLAGFGGAAGLDEVVEELAEFGDLMTPAPKRGGAS